MWPEYQFQNISLFRDGISLYFVIFLNKAKTASVFNVLVDFQ